MAKAYFVSDAEKSNFWKEVSKLGNIYIPRSFNSNFYFSSLTHPLPFHGLLRSPLPNGRGEEYKDDFSSISLEGYRTAEPIKSFFFPARTKVGRFKKEVTSPEEKVVLAGVRACDLNSLKILDYVFKEGDFKDPFYIKRRENTFIIASDCTSAKEVCFCTYFGSFPYPAEGYDLVTSSIKGGMLVENGSERGEKFLKAAHVQSTLKEASPDKVKERDAQRKKITDVVNKQVKENNLPDAKGLFNLVKKGQENPVWEEKARVCVECGACNLVCPTCHCFLLSEEKDGNTFSRYQLWDSCQYRLFAQVAGGANPRKYLSERIRNRFNKKFDFFYHILNTYACTGCGRCVEGCLAKIDLREVLKKLGAEESLSVVAR